MRFTHSQLTNNIDEVKQLLETNNTSEALTLLQGMDVKIDHMNTMFNDLVGEMSNKRSLTNFHNKQPNFFYHLVNET